MKIKNYSRIYPSLQALVNDVNLITNPENTFDVTLETGTIATTVSNQFVGLNSVIMMMPTTTTAAQEDYWITNDVEQFVINHTIGNDPDRTYKYFIYG